MTHAGRGADRANAFVSHIAYGVALESARRRYAVVRRGDAT